MTSMRNIKLRGIMSSGAPRSLVKLIGVSPIRVMLASSPTLNPALQEVTNVVKPGGGMY